MTLLPSKEFALIRDVSSEKCYDSCLFKKRDVITDAFSVPYCTVFINIGPPLEREDTLFYFLLSQVMSIFIEDYSFPFV